MKWAYIIGLLILVPQIVNAETIKLKSGELIEGTVLEKFDEYIIVDSGNDAPIHLDADDIVGISSGDPVVSLNPELISIMNKAISSKLQGNFEEALKYLNEALVMDENNPDINYEVGLFYYEVKDDHKKASYYLEKSVQEKPSHDLAWFYLGRSYVPFPETRDKAVECFKKALNIKPSEERYKEGLAQAYFGIATNYAKTKEYEKVRENLNLSKELLEEVGNHEKLEKVNRLLRVMPHPQKSK